MLWAVILLCIVKCTLGDGEDVDSRVVNTKQGPVRGYKSPDGDFYVFYGVPYATAPSGSQRYQAPLPPPIWFETFEAVIDKEVVCPQIDFGIINDKNIKENCLIANIYVPKTEENKLPVLVYVHGGAYVAGYANLVPPHNLAMTKRAIIVNFNYRLGAHGFLCLGTEDIPGNAGMKDQVALLRWVKDNIASFGGNPDDVTIAGYSAGSSAVDLLMLSKMANGLFKKVIPESGANTATFSVQVDPVEVAKKYAKRLNFTNVDDIYALEEFYKTAPYSLLTSINVITETDGTFIFSPCVERDTGVERFLEDNPVNILKNGDYEKLPMLYGFAKMEGLLRIELFEGWKERMNTKFSDFLPTDLQFTGNDKEKVAAKVKEFYFGNEPISNENILGYIDFMSDIYFTYSTLTSVRLQVEAGNNQLYLYEYAYVDDISPLIPHTNIRGANHCAQTVAVLDGLNFTHRDESIISDDYRNVKQTIRDIWLNFVETGKPIPDSSALPAWPPTGANASPYMILDKVLELKETPMLEERMRLWNEIYSKHYRYPSPPGEPIPKHSEL